MQHRRSQGLGQRKEKLSVSSVGSEAMQLPRAVKTPLRHHGLSVSSVGSEAMQLSGGDWPVRMSLSFSILGRIGGDATTLFFEVYSNNDQYFQYPRSDRRRCNTPTSPAPPMPVPTFSILGRIGGDATTCRICQTGCHSHFQYPRSDRRRCNQRPGTDGAGC